VSMSTGAVNATITGTVYADNKLAIYEVDKVLLPLDVLLPKPNKAPAPKSSADKSGDTNKNMDDDSGVPVEASGGCMNFNSVLVKWMSFVVGVAFMGGAMI